MKEDENLKMVDYYKAQIKLNNYYAIYNSFDKKNNKIVKDIFDYKKIKNKTFKFDDYNIILYEELLNTIYDSFEFELKLIYKQVNGKEENIINIIKDLPKQVVDVINKALLNENIELQDLPNLKKDLTSPAVYYLSNVCDSMLDILEMIYEIEKYENTCEKFLNRDEGREEKELLNLIKKSHESSK